MSDESVVMSALTKLISRLQPASRWALKTALSAFEVDGAGGTMLMEIPPNGKHDPEVTFLTGRHGFALAELRKNNDTNRNR